MPTTWPVWSSHSVSVRVGFGSDQSKAVIKSMAILWLSLRRHYGGTRHPVTREGRPGAHSAGPLPALRFERITTAQSAPSDQLPFDLRPSLRHHRGSHKRLQLSST